MKANGKVGLEIHRAGIPITANGGGTPVGSRIGRNGF